MTVSEGLVKSLQSAHGYFKRTISIFDEADSSFAPDPELYTVAGHIAHAADSVDWFIEGAFGEGWNMEFEALIAKARQVTSLAEAVAWFDRAFAHAIEVVGQSSDEELAAPIGDRRIMEGAPRRAVVGGILDHTAHHRGSLAVYARLMGKVPPMPYG